jgi:FlaG/FlaF family flagellin (archaellin)
MSGEIALVGWRKVAVAVAAAGTISAAVVGLEVAKAPTAHAQGAAECGGKVQSYKGTYIAAFPGTSDQSRLTFDGSGNVSGWFTPSGSYDALPADTTYTADSHASAPLVIKFSGGSYGGSYGTEDRSFVSREQYCDNALDVNQVTAFGGTFKKVGGLYAGEYPVTYYLVQ